MKKRAFPTYTPGEPLPIQPGYVMYYIGLYPDYQIKEVPINGVVIFQDYYCAV